MQDHKDKSLRIAKSSHTLSHEGVHKEPVQAKSPYISEDIILHAPTGSGKTLAYGIGLLKVLEKWNPAELSSGKKRKVESDTGANIGYELFLETKVVAVILVPTKSLASQVVKVLNQVYEGTTINIESSSSLKRLPYIGRTVVLVLTPGKFLEYLTACKLEDMGYLIFDEADQLLDNADVKEGIKRIRQHRQMFEDKFSEIKEYRHYYAYRRLFPPIVRWSFSATVNPSKMDLLDLRDPAILSLEAQSSKYAVPPNIAESYMTVTRSATKNDMLIEYLGSCGEMFILCFVNNTDTLEKLERQLKKQQVYGVVAMADGLRLHNEKTLILCTDNYTRGIDLTSMVDDIGSTQNDLLSPLVIHYDIPLHPRTYLHRIGRSGRANKSGRSVAFVEFSKVKPFRVLLEKLERQGTVKREHLERKAE